MINSDPFFSIITASLNNQSTIETTLKSVKDQSYKGVEHIVVDGVSNDDTLKVLREYEKHYELTFISEPDEGIADALNKGLNLAAGKYILVLHADDYLLDDKVIEKVYTSLKSEEYDIYSFPVLVAYPEDQLKSYKPFPLHFWYHFKTIIPHQGAFVHRRVYEKIGKYGKDFKIALDYDFFYRAFKSKCSVNLQKDFVAVMNGTGISNRNDMLVKRILEEFRVQKRNEEKLFWKMIQTLYQFLYKPYKTKFLPKL